MISLPINPLEATKVKVKDLAPEVPEYTEFEANVEDFTDRELVVFPEHMKDLIYFDLQTGKSRLGRWEITEVIP